MDHKLTTPVQPIELTMTQQAPKPTIQAPQTIRTINLVTTNGTTTTAPMTTTTTRQIILSKSQASMINRSLLTSASGGGGSGGGGQIIVLAPANRAINEQGIQFFIQPKPAGASSTSTTPATASKIFVQAAGPSSISMLKNIQMSKPKLTAEIIGGVGGGKPAPIEIKGMVVKAPVQENPNPAHNVISQQHNLPPHQTATLVATHNNQPLMAPKVTDFPSSTNSHIIGLLNSNRTTTQHVANTESVVVKPKKGFGYLISQLKVS